MEFLPLAKSTMKGDGVCVAGVDVNTGIWFRPVLEGYRCLFTREAAAFDPNAIHHVLLGLPQPRSAEHDPYGRHTEDRILRGQPERLRCVAPAEKLHILNKFKEEDLRGGLLSGGCSICLVQPSAFRCCKDDKGAYRWDFSVSGAWISKRQDQLRSWRIDIGSRGCKCTCPEWQAFADARFGSELITGRSLRRLPGAPTLFLTLSLTAIHNGQYWLVVAGVHLVGEDRIWL